MSRGGCCQYGGGAGGCAASGGASRRSGFRGCWSLRSLRGWRPLRGLRGKGDEEYEAIVRRASSPLSEAPPPEAKTTPPEPKATPPERSGPLSVAPPSYRIECPEQCQSRM